MFQDSFNKICNITGKYCITFDSNILPVQSGKHLVPIESYEEIETHLRT